MCPNKKMDWFKANDGWRSEDRTEVGNVVRKRWTETYLKRSTTPNDATNKPKAPEKVSFNFFQVDCAKIT